MTDYYAQVFGHFNNARKWSTGRHITSNQSPAALLTTWSNAWTTAWNDATNGFKLNYPTGLAITNVQIATLDGTMKQTAKVGAPLALAGTSAGFPLPTSLAVVLAWSSSTQIGRTKRGHMAMPAPAENAVLNDTLTGTAQGQFSAAINLVKSAINADGSTFFVYPKFVTSTGIPAFTKTVTDVVKARDKMGSMDERMETEGATYV